MAKIKAIGGPSVSRVLETLGDMDRHFQRCSTYWAYPKMPKYVEDLLDELRPENHEMWLWAGAYADARLAEEQWEFKAIWET